MPFSSWEEQDDWEQANGVFWQDCEGVAEDCRPEECFKHFPDSIPY